MTIVVSDMSHSGMTHSGNPINSFEVGPSNVYSMFRIDILLDQVGIAKIISSVDLYKG